VKNNTHWQEAPFGILFENVTSSSLKLPQKSYLKTGKYQVIDQGENQIGGFTDSELLVHPGPLPVLVFGDHTRCVKFVSRPFVQGADGVKILAPAPSASGRFLYWLLKQKTTEIRNKGYARHFAELKKTRLFIPPLPEQHRIVAALESYLTRLDDAIASLERVQRNLKRYRASVLKAAVEGRLVPTEAELARQEGRSYEPAPVLLERILVERKKKWIEDAVEKGRTKAEEKIKKAGKPWTAEDDAKALEKERAKATKKYKEPQPPDTEGLPDLPEGWCWAGPDQLAADEPYALGIGPFGSNLRTPDYQTTGVPLVFVRNIRSERFGGQDDKFVSAGKAEELKAHSIQPGDVLITKMGEPPGDSCLYPSDRPKAIITADCIKIRPHPSLKNGIYLVYAIRSHLIKTQISGITKGVAQKKVSLARFKTVAFPLPPVAEQERIVGQLERVLSVTNAESDIVQANNHRIQRLRQSILKWAFEGRLVDQDPNDEPASVLLERIKAERGAIGKENGNGRGKRRVRTGRSKGDGQ